MHLVSLRCIDKLNVVRIRTSAAIEMSNKPKKLSTSVEIEQKQLSLISCAYQNSKHSSTPAHAHQILFENMKHFKQNMNKKTHAQKPKPKHEE